MRPAPAGAAVGQGVVDQRSSRWGLGHRRRRPLRGEGGTVPGGGGELADAVDRLLGHVGGVEAVEGARIAVVAPSTPWQI
jgi:hypothetical protein